MSAPPRGMPPARLDVAALAAGVREGSRAAIARAITLVESSRPDHRVLASELLAELAPHTGGSVRVGITGVPGAGKSTFINALGVRLIARGSRVGVVAVDPSSRRTGGSILGDRTRMGELTQSEQAFVRPSPSGRQLGGVARATRESSSRSAKPGRARRGSQAAGARQPAAPRRSSSARTDPRPAWLAIAGSA